ncbi:MAG: DNA-deoxyinosine glycosylase [Clostridia bacterium]|nr:DNA-deoxyinosine glycosylase [Clostridia bacterium]
MSLDKKNKFSEEIATQYGLAPVYSPDCTHLILGSFPSVMSRNYFYYGNPRNRLWSVLAEITGDTVPPHPDGKRDFLLYHKIAMWDIVSYCDIRGSGDADIKIVSDKQINDIPALIKGGSIKKILCNGSKSFALFNRYHAGKMNIETVLLPSTSPANFKFDIEKWRDALTH